MTSERSPGGLKNIRTRYQLTQQMIAEKLGVSQQTVARWERKGGEVPTKYLKDVAVLLGCRVDDLLGGPSSRTVSGRKKARDQEKEREKDLAYGTLRLVFCPSTAGPDDELTWNGPTLPGQVTYEYPISERTRSFVYRQLAERKTSWIVFDSLDDQTVLVNTNQLLSLEMIGDDVEQTPPYFHEEIYKAVAELLHSPFLETGEMPPDVDADSSKYSRAFLHQCWLVTQEWGGHEGVFDHLHGVTVETLEGHRKTLVNDEPSLFIELSDLLDQITHGSVDDTTSMNDWMVDLYSEGYYRSTFVRLGALRLVVVSTFGMASIIEQSFELNGTE